MKNMKIEVSHGEIDYEFLVTAQKYNKYINSVTPTNKIQPAINFLMSVVKKEQCDQLKQLLELPGAALHLVGAIIEDYQPEFNFTVKKSSVEQEE
ncbi:putative phage tail assembly chaperone [Pseudoalteromonas luteoviolacea]|uniref:putative phage tail assembly chaperone n=1 Tax=Pseudoalteromonas luteoviolacea TaxID=43657 RepID=UPI001F1B534A|nr:putative phage tail assembly chaperone [Pseudoalteromonas luteoviolacea]MCF6442352.1 putative phage tail assembly chaperone [Pseudoalteromonas luteoviolacea]